MNYLKLFGIAAFAIGAILYLASADDHQVILGDQDYDLGEYVKISVSSSVDLKVTSGAAYALNVKADAEDLKKLKIYVKGRTLVIENRESLFNSWQGSSPEITISLPLLRKFTLNGASDAEITGIHGSAFKVVVNGSGAVSFSGRSDDLTTEINGSGDVESNDFATSESRVEINGSGSVDLSGSCDGLEIEINGSGNFTGRDFICKKAEVDVLGSGDIEVYASQALDVDVMGSSDVNVYGNPAQVRDRSRKSTHVVMR